MVQIGDMLGSFIHGAWRLDRQLANDFAAIAILAVPLLLIELLQEKACDQAAPLRLSLLPRTALLAGLMLMIVGVGNTGSRAFIYFQF